MFQAKSFLCWDKFPQLSIKLIPLQNSSAFFYPPDNDLATILVFYESNPDEFSQPLYLLFHEAGHYRQWQNYVQYNKVDAFWQLINLDKGNSKLKFEREAWSLGRILLSEFLKKYQISVDKIMENYDSFMEECLLSY